MASFAEMIYGSAMGVAKDVGSGVPDAMARGAELALRKEQLEQKRQELEAAKEEAKRAKWEKVGKIYEQYDKMPEGPAKKNFGTKMIPSYLNVLGLSQDMNPAVAEMMQVDPELGVFFVSKSAAGETNQAEISEAVKDTEKFTALVTRLGIKTWADEKKLAGTATKYGPEIAKAEEAARGRASAAKLAATRGSGTNDRFDTKLSLQKEDTIRKDVNKISDAFTATQQQLNEATAHVKSGNTREVGMIIASIARNVGEQKGSLSDGDVNRSIPPDIATDVSGLIAYLGKEDAKISKPLQKALLNLIEGARAKSKKIVGTSLSKRRAQYSAGEYADVMERGRSGDVAFKEAEDLLKDGREVVVDGVRYPEANWAEAKKRAEKHKDHPKSKKLLEAIEKAEAEGRK